jgi:ADP-ribose pyrophosphatase YjhB (NUDIX family)
MKTIKKIDKSRLIALKGEKILVLEKRGLKRQYTLAGGIRKKKETDKGSLIRETSEEIGQLLNKRDLSYFISRKTTNKAEKEIYKHYFITTKNIENIEVQEPHKLVKL